MYIDPEIFSGGLVVFWLCWLIHRIVTDRELWGITIFLSSISLTWLIVGSLTFSVLEIKTGITEGFRILISIGSALGISVLLSYIWERMSK